MDKDYSLLRPFDEEAAKNGELCCWYDDGERLKYIGRATTRDNCGCFEWLDREHDGTFEVYMAEYIRMAPLAWVDGKPVYKGDELYWHPFRGADFSKVIATELSESGSYLRFDNGRSWNTDGSMSKLTWTPPKVKRDGWINLYSPVPYVGPVAKASDVYPTKAEADQKAAPYRIACVRIEFEV